MVISPLIAQGQSHYQIITNHPKLDMSVRTLYNYLDEGILTARNIDLKREKLFLAFLMNRCTKGAVRMVLPKGTSFEFLTRWDVNLIVNHINSTPRESLAGETPYAAALRTYGESALKALQLRPVAPDEVNLTPKLIKYNR